MASHIHSIADRMLTRADRQELLEQKSTCLWFTGLSGSGKSTIAIALEKELFSRGYLVQILDGDNLRLGLNNNLGFAEADRIENIRRVAEVAKLYIHTGVIVICSFVSPTKAIREVAKDIIGEDFKEVYVHASLEVCEQRDVKGLYKKARAGEIPDFTGIHQPFEPPIMPQLTLDTEKNNLLQCLDLVLDYLDQHSLL